MIICKFWSFYINQIYFNQILEESMWPKRKNEQRKDGIRDKVHVFVCVFVCVDIAVNQRVTWEDLLWLTLTGTE